MRQQKIVAIILTLTLVAALLVTPALALDAACPECGTVHSHYAVEEAVYNNVTVSSCDYASYSHTHVYYRIKYTYKCNGSCGEYTAWSGSTARIFCGASNMNMRAINMIN